MTLAARGAYRELCEAQFKLAGKGVHGLPRDDGALARYIGCELEEWLSVKNRVLAEFDPVGGRFVNPKVAKEIKFTEAKIRGGKARWASGEQQGEQTGEQRGAFRPNLRGPQRTPTDFRNVQVFSLPMETEPPRTLTNANGP